MIRVTDASQLRDGMRIFMQQDAGPVVPAIVVHRYHPGGIAGGIYYICHNYPGYAGCNNYCPLGFSYSWSMSAGNIADAYCDMRLFFLEHPKCPYA